MRRTDEKTGAASDPARPPTRASGRVTQGHGAEMDLDERVPLVDLALQHRPIAETIHRRWDEVITSTTFVLGAPVGEFERAFASFCGVRSCIGVGSGTDALELALRALDVGPGDEVIVPANSFIASASAVARAGATPVLTDVDPVFLLIDPEKAADRVTPRTAGVIAVHLFGQLAPMEGLRGVANRRIPLIEDAAQAHGAKRNGIGAGGFGVAAATSFYPGKNLGAYGDAGAVLTDDEDVAWRVRALRDHGSSVKYEHPVLGFNSRLDTLQAVVLAAKLPLLPAWNESRREAALRYDELLRDLPEVTPPSVLEGNEHAWHLYVIRIPRRDHVLSVLNASGIGAGVHYPIPIHFQGAFRHLGYTEGDFPEAERASREILSLPLYPGITARQQERVVDALRKALR